MARVARRTGTRPSKNILFPSYWSIDRSFDPYYVRSRAETIGYAVVKALNARRYRPQPAISFEVPKEGGGTRVVSVFPVADNAISRVVYRQLLAKNSSRLSARCYAYRRDITLHDAVLDIAADLRGRSRLFVAEFDFKKYFDSISHEHIEQILLDGRFFVTETELAVIRAFLRAPTLVPENYQRTTTDVRLQGIPQGTSISLFLANIAAHPLDRQLERLGVGCARFADDTLIWSDDYSSVCRAANILEAAATAMGVDINVAKSPGVSILTPEGASAEFRAKPAIEFLGYKISASQISIRERSVARIKEWIAYLVYSNLIEAPKRGILLSSRISPKVDRDYVVMIFQLRRYLYGDLTESKLRRFLAKDTPRVQYRGLMSFYPILTDERLMRELDGWLLHLVYTSVRYRGRLFRNSGAQALPLPHGLPKKALISFYGTSSGGALLDLRTPSFVRIAKLVRRAARTFGANAVANPLTLYGTAAVPPTRGYDRII